MIRILFFAVLFSIGVWFWIGRSLNRIQRMILQAGEPSAEVIHVFMEQGLIVLRQWRRLQYAIIFLDGVVAVLLMTSGVDRYPGMLQFTSFLVYGGLVLGIVWVLRTQAMEIMATRHLPPPRTGTGSTF